MQQYARRAAAAPGHPATNAALRASASSLAFTQHALPTIVTPFGIAVLVVALRLRPGGIAVVEILALTALVLALDLLAMLPADRILKGPLVASTPNIMGAVMNVLQMALGVAVSVEIGWIGVGSSSHRGLFEAPEARLVPCPRLLHDPFTGSLKTPLVGTDTRNGAAGVVGLEWSRMSTGSSTPCLRVGSRWSLDDPGPGSCATACIARRLRPARCRTPWECSSRAARRRR
jgi:hypothetical protein